MLPAHPIAPPEAVHCASSSFLPNALGSETAARANAVASDVVSSAAASAVASTATVTLPVGPIVSCRVTLEWETRKVVQYVKEGQLYTFRNNTPCCEECSFDAPTDRATIFELVKQELTSEAQSQLDAIEEEAIKRASEMMEKTRAQLESSSTDSNSYSFVSVGPAGDVNESRLIFDTRFKLSSTTIIRTSSDGFTFKLKKRTHSDIYSLQTNAVVLPVIVFSDDVSAETLPSMRVRLSAEVPSV